MAGKLPADMSHGEVARILERNGVTFDRETTHGSLHVHPDDRTRRALVPRHRRISKGTLDSIIRHSKKPREDFMRK